MNLSVFCIRRPVFATVLSLVLIVIGLIGYQHLRTRFFPQFTRNTIFIITAYPGASASLIESSVTTPLEKAISGIEGIKTTTSVSGQGLSDIKVKIKLGTQAYDLTNKIRNQVAMATAKLPSTIKSPIVQMGHGNIDLIDVGFSITGNHLDTLRDYLDRYFINQVEQLPGISAVSIAGGNSYAMRIAMNPEKMAALKISANDIQEAISNSNLQLPAGVIKTPTMNIPLTAKTALHSAKQFGRIVIKNDNDHLIYLKDIATVKLGSDAQTKSIVRINGKPAILLSIFNATDANPISTSQRVRHLLAGVKNQLPSNMAATITFDQSTYMRASISEVYKTISIATVFVVLILLLTLGKIRSSLIPIVTIPICLLATMGFMYFLGFSINIITLLAIVLSIGLVVDDAIVVLENIHRHLEDGMDRLSASIKGSKEIAVPVIAMTLTLAAVYAPIGLIKGSVAHIFQSFAFTLASAVLISGFVALTLSPMLCSKFLTHKNTPTNKFSTTVNNLFNRLTNTYQANLSWILKHRFIIVTLTVILAFSGYFLLKSLPKTFMPKEDMGFLVTILHSETGSNNAYSENHLAQLTHILLKHQSIKTNVSVSDSHSSTANSPDNMIFSTLQPYQKRLKSADQLVKLVNTQIQGKPGLNAISFAPSFGGSVKNQLSFYMMASASYQYLYKTGNQLVEKLSHYPGIRNLRSNIQFNNQQYVLTVNRALAAQLQVSIRTIDDTLSNFLGGTTVSTFNLNGQTYDVYMQAEKKYLQSTEAIKKLQVPTQTGELIPLSNLIKITPTLKQTSLFHYNRQRAARISAELAPGYKLGDVVHYLQNTLPKLLPPQVKFAFAGQAARILQSSNTMSTIFLLSLAFIYLVLSAQFESFLDPFIILLSVPLSIVGALASLKMVDGSINLYTVIGLVTLVGLIAKHGILITQFANTLQEKGTEVTNALIQAASIRLRPILMTTAAMTFGAFPLIFATGASAVSRQQIGMVIVGGLLFGTFFSLILVPIAYSYMAQFKIFIKRMNHAG